MARQDNLFQYQLPLVKLFKIEAIRHDKKAVTLDREDVRDDEGRRRPRANSQEANERQRKSPGCQRQTPGRLWMGSQALERSYCLLINGKPKFYYFLNFLKSCQKSRYMYQLKTFLPSKAEVIMARIISAC